MLTLRKDLFAVALALALLMLGGCHGQTVRNTVSITADISMEPPTPGVPSMAGKLYLKDSRLRTDWGEMAAVFDLKQRTGWQLFSDSKTYFELVSRDLSTFAPELTNGSPCPHAQVPSACKFAGNEVIAGRPAKKWDVYNPKGFHVYYWIDEALGVTLRMSFGDVAFYQVTNIRNERVPDSMFELPAGYRKVDRMFRP